MKRIILIEQKRGLSLFVFALACCWFHIKCQHVIFPLRIAFAHYGVWEQLSKTADILSYVKIYLFFLLLNNNNTNIVTDFVIDVETLHCWIHTNTNQSKKLIIFRYTHIDRNFSGMLGCMVHIVVYMSNRTYTLRSFHVMMNNYIVRRIRWQCNCHVVGCIKNGLQY